MQSCKLSTNVPSWKEILHYPLQSSQILPNDQSRPSSIKQCHPANCTIHVPVVEVTDNLKEEEKLKVASEEGICYSLTNQYYKTFYICPHDTVLYNNNVTQGYKPKFMYIYWVDYTHQSNGDININNYVLERPSLKSLEVWCDSVNIKTYEPKKNENSID